MFTKTRDPGREWRVSGRSVLDDPLLTMTTIKAGRGAPGGTVNP